MVDTDLVMDKIEKSLYTGAGAFLAKLVEPNIQGFINDDATISNAALIAGGVGTSIASDELIQDKTSPLNDAVEFAGYGISAVGWSEVGKDIKGKFSGKTSDDQTSGRVIEVSANTGKDKQTGQATDEEDFAQTHQGFQLNT